MDKKSLALIATSALFFSVFGMFFLVFTGGISGFRFGIPWFGSNYLAVILGILGLISFVGCILHLMFVRNRSGLMSL